MMKKHMNIHMISQLKKSKQADTDYQNLQIFKLCRAEMNFLYADNLVRGNMNMVSDDGAVLWCICTVM